ncbi:MAG: cytochrome c [bacterium]|nr:cytochrome c [bacterium]
MEPDDYQAWLTGGGPVAAPKDLGAQLFEQRICNTCHFEDGTGRGPSLVGIYGQEAKFTDGTSRVRDDDYLRESIMNPAADVVEGYLQIMPTYQGQLSEVSLLQLLSYVKSLSDAPAGEPAAASAENTEDTKP